MAIKKNSNKNISFAVHKIIILVLVQKEAIILYLQKNHCRGVIFRLHNLKKKNEKEEVTLVSIVICLNVVV